MTDRAFALVDPFEVDDGELDGLRPLDAFALGVEWATFRARIGSDGGWFTSTLHVSNEARVLRHARRYGRSANSRRVDSIWTEIAVMPRVLQ